nr:hypothetical protein [Tanacetum cinerariifolium]
MLNALNRSIRFDSPVRVSSLSDAAGEPLNFLRGDRRSTRIKDNTGDTSVAVAGEVVGNLHLLRDVPADADGVVE